MNHLIQALRFLTILPFREPDDGFSPSRALVWFPVAGLILGAAVSMFDVLMSELWPKAVVSVLDIVLLIVLSGAFHLDGLGDTADGLLGYRSRKAALDIMKDSRVGAMGVVAITCCIVLKCVALGALGAERSFVLVLVPAVSRLTPIMGMQFLTYCRESGTGKAFFEEAIPPEAWMVGIVPILLMLVLGFRGMLLITVFAGVVSAVLLWYRRRMGCITGDMLGALIEVSETGLLLAAAVGAG